MPCEILPCCQLINEQMKAMPKAADYLKEHICLGDFGYCTWYRVYRDFADGQVRPDLFDSPDMQEILKVQQCLQERREHPMEITITFPGGEKVNAEVNGRTIPTDQPVEAGGEGSAPTPFDYFLASLGTCAGIYVLSFCQQRQIATEGLAMTQRMEFNTTPDGKKHLATVTIEITLPAGFPDKYRNAITKAAGLCSVKKVIMDPPEFVITTRTA